MSEERNLQVNVNFSDMPELFDALEKMVAEDMMAGERIDRSKFIKKLVRQEVARRAQLELPGMEQPAKGKKEAARRAVTA